LALALGKPQIGDAREITDVTISTTSTNPLRTIVEIETAHSTITFELNEDMAHRICTGLERALTQE
jgi:hypothetical protein